MLASQHPAKSFAQALEPRQWPRSTEDTGPSSGGNFDIQSTPSPTADDTTDTSSTPDSAASDSANTGNSSDMSSSNLPISITPPTATASDAVPTGSSSSTDIMTTSIPDTIPTSTSNPFFTSADPQSTTTLSSIPYATALHAPSKPLPHYQLGLIITGAIVIPLIFVFLVAIFGFVRHKRHVRAQRKDEEREWHGILEAEKLVATQNSRIHDDLSRPGSIVTLDAKVAKKPTTPIIVVHNSIEPSPTRAPKSGKKRLSWWTGASQDERADRVVELPAGGALKGNPTGEGLTPTMSRMNRWLRKDPMEGLPAPGFAGLRSGSRDRSRSPRRGRFSGWGVRKSAIGMAV